MSFYMILFYIFSYYKKNEQTFLRNCIFNKLFKAYIFQNLAPLINTEYSLGPGAYDVNK